MPPHLAHLPHGFHGGLAPTPMLIGGCQKVFPCAGCCPGMSKYDTVTIAFGGSGVNGSISGSFTLTNAVLQYTQGIICGGPGPRGGCNDPIGYTCCGCNACNFTSPAWTGPASDTDCCPAVYPTCADRPVVGTVFGNEARWGGGIFACELNPSFSPGTDAACRMPTAPYGADPRRLNGVAGFSATVTFIFHCGAGDQFNLSFTAKLDCTTFRCYCPHGLHLLFGQGPLLDGTNTGLFLTPGAPGDPAIFDNGFIEITSAETGPPCPDSWPCPPGIKSNPSYGVYPPGGGGLMARVAAMSDAQVDAALQRELAGAP